MSYFCNMTNFCVKMAYFMIIILSWKHNFLTPVHQNDVETMDDKECS